MIPDEKCFCFEKTVLVYPLFGVQGRLPVAHCQCSLGSGAAEGLQIKPEGSRCSEMHSQPYLSTLNFLYIKICTI